MDAEKTDDRRRHADVRLDAEGVGAGVTNAPKCAATPQPFLDEWIERGRLAAEGVLWRFRTGSDVEALLARGPSLSLSNEDEAASEQAGVTSSEGAEPEIAAGPMDREHDDRER